MRVNSRAAVALPFFAYPVIIIDKRSHSAYNSVLWRSIGYNMNLIEKLFSEKMLSQNNEPEEKYFRLMLD